MNPVLLIVIPLLLAFISVLLKQFKNQILYLALLTNVALLFMLERGTVLIGSFNIPYGITLVLDQYSLIGVSLVNMFFLLAVIMNYKKIDKHAIVLQVLLAGLNGMILTGDLFNLFVFIEVTTISLFILTTLDKKYVATLNYIIAGAIGSGIYLVGVMLLYTMNGSLNFSEISQGTVTFLPVLLIFIGLSVELKLAPLNGWVKGVLKDANGLVGTMILSVVSTAALLVLGRLASGLFGLETIKTVVISISVLTLVVGEFSAYRSDSIKSILLYSSIGQAGLIVVLLVNGLVFPAIILMINNGIAKLVMFTIADELPSDYRGMFSGRKVLGLTFTISSLSLIGLPLFLGFYGKLNALIGLFEISVFLPLVVLLVTIIEGAYLLRLNITLWHPGEEGQVMTTSLPKEKPSISLAFVSLVLSVVILLVGIVPNLLGDKLIDQPLLDDRVDYMIDMKGGE
jgi:multicomponent Na+:H+ antiporter subunit D